MTSESANDSNTSTIGVRPPLAMLAELTHRCPLQCPYCSNPLNLSKRSEELSTGEWIDVIEQAAAIGVLQIHLSGGEPTARKDLDAIIAASTRSGIYTNLITSGVLVTQEKLRIYQAAGLDHVQLSIQDSDATNADVIGNYRGGHQKKLATAGWVKELGLPLTVNAVVHRSNLDHLEQIIELAVELGAQRLEIANVQYYGWALDNRATLMPSREQVERATRLVEVAKEKYRGVMAFDYVVPDYFAKRPKRCMDGWGSQFFAVTPRGLVLPCHAAESITGMTYSSVREAPLKWIWENDAAFNRFRGFDWMPAQCKNCPDREKDLGGCRCQAFAITGDAHATDPVCEFSEFHAQLVSVAEGAGEPMTPEYIYRN